MSNRAPGRNVHIYSARDTDTVLGGLSVTNGMTNANFYSMVEIIIKFDNYYTLLNENGTSVPRDDHPLQVGNYLVDTPGTLSINNEPWLVRTKSVASEDATKGFRDAVRQRDFRCVITGDYAPMAEYGFWSGYTATHIFPLEYKQHWVDHGYDSWITIPGSEGSINSVQNGILLRGDIRTFFECYILSINPDVGITGIFHTVLTTYKAF